MQGFRSVGGLPRFISIFPALRNLFVPPHQKSSALAIHDQINGEIDYVTADVAYDGIANLPDDPAP